MFHTISKKMHELDAHHHGFKVTWFNHWNPSLDEALYNLPENDLCPHELYRLLIQNPVQVTKGVALITSQGEPVAVVGLRKKGRLTWELATQWIIPGFVFPAIPEYVSPSLDALDKDVWIAWWRMGCEHPHSKLVRYLGATPTYRMCLSSDCERYWGEHGYLRAIRRMRNRCRCFSSKIDAPGSTEWTIYHWAMKWHADPEIEDPSISDRILAALYLQKLGLYHTLTLWDGDQPIGGATVTAHGKDLVAGVIYRDPRYDYWGVGNRLIDLCFSFALENGFESFDIGGGHEYKHHWAPQEGEHHIINICPESLFQFKRIVHRLRSSNNN